jgi:hypothetical protein
MFAMIVKNSILIEEITRIIQAFPHAVLIEKGLNCYSNQEFEKSIKKINEHMDELDNIKVRLEGNEDIKDLRELLKSQVKKLEREGVTEEHSVLLHPHLNDEEGSEEEENLDS